jgi:hypothetical protein
MSPECELTHSDMLYAAAKAIRVVSDTTTVKMYVDILCKIVIDKYEKECK